MKHMILDTQKNTGKATRMPLRQTKAIEDDMNDKERILYTLVQRIYMKALYGDPGEVRKWRDAQPGMLTGLNPLQKGDLVIAATSLEASPFMVGYYEGQSETGGALIREIGSDRLCDYANEWFYRIEKSILGPEILDGERYALYKKVENAAQDINGDTYYVTAFELDDYSCKISLRKCWRKNEIRNIRLPIEKTSSIEDIRAGLSAAIEKETTNES